MVWWTSWSPSQRPHQIRLITWQNNGFNSLLKAYNWNRLYARQYRRFGKLFHWSIECLIALRLELKPCATELSDGPKHWMRSGDQSVVKSGRAFQSTQLCSIQGPRCADWLGEGWSTDGNGETPAEQPLSRFPPLITGSTSFDPIDRDSETQSPHS